MSQLTSPFSELQQSADLALAFRVAVTASGPRIEAQERCMLLRAGSTTVQ
ncbi:hypothetical protein [Rhodoferax sp.]